MPSSKVSEARPSRTLDLEWVPENKRFEFGDLVTWHGKEDGAPFDSVASRIDTIVVGPHASAAYPAELRPFVSQALTRRKQHDYSDCSTKAVGRRWAEVDPHVVFIENPHARWIFDPNRARPKHDDTAWSPEPLLRRFYGRRRRIRNAASMCSCCVSQSTLMRFAFVGVDTVRPVTFAGEDVLVEPQSDEEWRHLSDALSRAAEMGARRYDEALVQVVDAVLEKRGKGSPLQFISLHDTCNHQMTDNGAIVRERPEAGRYPKIVNFGNVGNADGDADCCMMSSCRCDPRLLVLRAMGNQLSTSGSRMRGICAAWASAFGEEVGSPDRWARDLGTVAPSKVYTRSFSFNRPSLGVVETFGWAKEFHKVRSQPQVAVFQVEFEREQLLGREATEALKQDGESWPPEQPEYVESVRRRVEDVASALRRAGDILRRQE